MIAHARERLGPLGVEVHIGKNRIRQVPVRCVPFDVLLEESDVVPAAVQRRTKRAKGGRMAVSPGRGDGQAKDSDAQLHLRSRPGTSCREDTMDLAATLYISVVAQG